MVDRDVLEAERDCACQLLDRLERAMTRIGGFVEPADQAAIRDARAFLIAHGIRKSDAPQIWRDRSPPARPDMSIDADDTMRAQNRAIGDREPSPAAWRLKTIVIRGLERTAHDMARQWIAGIMASAPNELEAATRISSYLESTGALVAQSRAGESLMFEVLYGGER